MNDIERARVLKIVRQAHVNNEAQLYTEVAELFGQRLGMAEEVGIPLEQAIVAAQEHFRLMAKAFAEIAEAAPSLIELSEFQFQPRGNS